MRRQERKHSQVGSVHTPEPKHPAPRPRPPQHLSNLIREDKIRFLVGTWTRCWNSSALLYRFQSPARGRPPRSSAQGQHVRDDSVFRERPGNQRPQLRGSSRPLCLVGMLYPRQEAKARETSLFSFLLSKVVVTMAIKCYSSKRTKELLVGLGIFAIIQVELWGWKGDRFLILLRFDFPGTIASSATCKHQKGFVRGPRVFPHQPGLPSVSHHRTGLRGHVTAAAGRYTHPHRSLLGMSGDCLPLRSHSSKKP